MAKVLGIGDNVILGNVVGKVTGFVKQRGKIFLTTQGADGTITRTSLRRVEELLDGGMPYDEAFPTESDLI